MARMRAAALACIAAVLFACGGTAIAQHESASRAAAGPCAKCHGKVVNLYAHAPMRNALAPLDGDPVLLSHTNLSVKENGFTYTVATRNGKSTYTVSDGTRSLTLPIRWALGQRSQTWVLEKDGHLYESLVSFFQQGENLATTPGDEAITPHTLEDAVGRELPVWEVRNCFTCHASNYNPDQKLDAQRLTPGLNCERCHEDSVAHAADAVRGDLTSIPASMRDFSAEETDQFCGQCHRTWDRVVREGWHGPPTVRFQPYRLENSRCFDPADKRISCIACHDPHQGVSHSEAFYDSRCLACHSPAHVPAAASASSPKLCPVAKANCVHCHMPRVEVAGGHAVFTDHEIRVVRPGTPYPN
jgi:Cytochrome c554 and c-prime